MALTLQQQQQQQQQPLFATHRVSKTRFLSILKAFCIILIICFYVECYDKNIQFFKLKKIRKYEMKYEKIRNSRTVSI